MTTLRVRLSRGLHRLAYRIDPRDDAGAVIWAHHAYDIQYFADRFPDVDRVKADIGLWLYREPAR